MSTTTIRIEDELKARVAVAAQHAGTSTHAFMLEAITRTVEQVEMESAFNTLAEQRWAKIQAGGKTVPWDEAKAYLTARAKGESKARKPAARKLT